MVCEFYLNLNRKQNASQTQRLLFPHQSAVFSIQTLSTRQLYPSGDPAPVRLHGRVSTATLLPLSKILAVMDSYTTQWSSFLINLKKNAAVQIPAVITRRSANPGSTELLQPHSSLPLFLTQCHLLTCPPSFQLRPSGCEGSCSPFPQKLQPRTFLSGPFPPVFRDFD